MLLRSKISLCILACSLSTISIPCYAQAAATSIPVVPWITVQRSKLSPLDNSSLLRTLPELYNADSLPTILGKFNPQIAEGQLVGSDYLWLDAPPIALSGSITVHLVSEIPGTDLILLLNKKPRADEASLLSAHIIPPLMKAEVRTPITLTSTTDLMFIARANGRWYKVSSEVKVAVKSKK